MENPIPITDRQVEKLKYIKVLLRRGLRLASSSAIILIPTIVIYLIERTGTFGDETPAIIFSRYPLDFVIDVISHTKIPAGVGAAALLALLLLKSLTVYFVSEDIYRLREGEDRRRYSKILSTVRYQYVVRFLAFYASWHV